MGIVVYVQLLLLVISLGSRRGVIGEGIGSGHTSWVASLPGQEYCAVVQTARSRVRVVYIWTRLRCSGFVFEFRDILWILYSCWVDVSFFGAVPIYIKSGLIHEHIGSNFIFGALYPSKSGLTHIVKHIVMVPIPGCPNTGDGSVLHF
jgi:hypothetical protein